MAFDITKYPLAWRALEEMKASYSGEEEGSEFQSSLAITQRTLEVIEAYADGSSSRKENLMATTAIMRRKGTVFGMDTADIETSYNPHILSLIVEVQQGLNESKGGGATRDILEVATAAQIATHEMMIAWATPQAAPHWRKPLEKYRAHRDRSAYADLAGTPMQRQEMKIYNDLMAVVHELSGANSSAPAKQSGAEPRVLH